MVPVSLYFRVHMYKMRDSMHMHVIVSVPLVWLSGCCVFMRRDIVETVHTYTVGTWNHART